MNGWDQMEMTKSEQGSSIFIKLKDGDEIEGVFRGNPYTFYQAFKERVEYDKWAEGRSFRFRIPLVVQVNGMYSAKIFQGGAMLRDALIDVRNEYGLDCLFKIKRTGSGKDDTRYSILFKGKLTDEQLEKINAIKLPILMSSIKGVDAVGETKYSDNVPF